MQIVDDHQAQIVQTAALGVHIRHRQQGVVVDADVQAAEGGSPLGNADPVALPQVPGDQPGVVDKPLPSQQPGHQLLPGHFQGEHGHGFPAGLGGVHRHVQAHTGLAHTGAAGQQQQVRLIQAVDLPVHVGKAGGQPRHSLSAGGGKLSQPLQDGLQHHADGHHVLGAAAPADGIDLLLRRLQNLGRLPGALLDHGGDVRRGGGHRPQQGLFPDDPDIFHDVGAGGGHLHQLDQIAPGVVGGQARPLHLSRHGNAVDGLGVDEHGIDGLENLPIPAQIEVLRLELIHHVLHAVGVDEHRAQHRLLRLRRVGHLANQQFIRGHENPLLSISCKGFLLYLASQTRTFTRPLIS